MRKFNNLTNKGKIRANTSYEGVSIEEKINKILQNNEPIDSTAPIIYTSRADGVQPAYDVRADRFDIAIEAMDKVSKSKIATREAYMKAEKGGSNKSQETGTNKSPETGVNTSDNRQQAV